MDTSDVFFILEQCLVLYKLTIKRSILLRTEAREPVNLFTIIVNAYFLLPSIRYPAKHCTPLILPLLARIFPSYFVLFIKYLSVPSRPATGKEAKKSFA